MHAYTNREGAPGTTSQVLRIKREETRSFGKVGLFSRTSCRAHTPGCACVWYVYVYVYVYEYGCRNGCVDEFMHLHVYMSSYHFYPFPSQRTKFFGNDSGRLVLCRSVPWTWNSTHTTSVSDQSSRSSSPLSHGRVEHRCQARSNILVCLGRYSDYTHTTVRHEVLGSRGPRTCAFSAAFSSIGGRVGVCA